MAKLLNETRDAGDWGLTYAEPEIDLTRLNAWKDGVVGTMTGGLRQLARARKITCVEGTATFVDAHTLRVAAANGAGQELSFEHAIIDAHPAAAVERRRDADGRDAQRAAQGSQRENRALDLFELHRLHH